MKLIINKIYNSNKINNRINNSKVLKLKKIFH